MKSAYKVGAVLLALAALFVTTPALAAHKVARRDPAATAALTTIDQMQATLTAIQQLIDGINARHNQQGTAIPAPRE